MNKNRYSMFYSKKTNKLVFVDNASNNIIFCLKVASAKQYAYFKGCLIDYVNKKPLEVASDEWQ